MTTDELIENFELLGDWEERFGYLIELGRALPALPAGARTDENKVTGCMSQVWLVGGAQGGVMRYQADSDAHIVRGLIAVLMVLLDGQPPAQVLATDVGAIFRTLGLDSHLSPNRRNGFAAMVERMRALAAAAS
ncbi:MAG: SufE family protein [Myxococcales bacterium]|nr:SufE family protein [Myxococcales bacterium]